MVRRRYVRGRVLRQSAYGEDLRTARLRVLQLPRRQDNLPERLLGQTVMVQASGPPDRMTGTFESPSPESTFEIGERVGRELRPGDVLLLRGGLGAGKTLLTKGIVNALE